MEDKDLFRIALANAFAEYFWMKGLLSDDELVKFKSNSAEAFSLKKVNKVPDEKEIARYNPVTAK